MITDAEVRQGIQYLKLLHGFYNSVMMFLFIYQGVLGIRIRAQRKKGAGSVRFEIVKRHRNTGPFLAVAGVAGFFFGAILTYIDNGRVLKYPIHFFTGLIIASLIVSTYSISRKIRNETQNMRNIHYVIGITILCLYPLQVLLGLGILF